MAAQVSKDWKNMSSEEILKKALPTELLISEINPKFNPEEDE